MSSATAIQRILTLMLVASLNLAVTSMASAQSSTQDYDNLGGWSLHLDNDLLVSSDRDQDYTGGFAVTLSGKHARRFPVSTDRMRQAVGRQLRLPGSTRGSYSLRVRVTEFGVALFSPANITSSEPLHDEHPYASLFFLTSAQQALLKTGDVALSSELTLGLLGLPVAENLHQAIHRTTGSEIPRGWEYQISAGGEPTARYTLGLQRKILSTRQVGRPDIDMNATARASVGFTTDVSLGLNARFGLIRKPWWTFNPHQSEYTTRPTPGSLAYASPLSEVYAYVGTSARYRAYSALLQGQFRDSDVVYRASDLQNILYEHWAGLSVQFGDGLRAEVFIRDRSAGLQADRNARITWGGISFEFSHR